MSRNNIKPLVDVKPPQLLKELRADMVKMAKSTDGWDWPFKRITLNLGMKTLTFGRVLFVEPCEACGDGESKKDIFFSDLLLLVELAYRMGAICGKERLTHRKNWKNCRGRTRQL